MTDVVAALIRDAGRILVCQRPEGKMLAGCWEFPGGKPEPGETPQEALARECLEELNADISVGDLVCEVTHEYPDLTVRLQLYEARIAGRPPRLLEHQDMRWVTEAELDGLEFCPADVDIIHLLQERAGVEKG